MPANLHLRAGTPLKAELALPPSFSLVSLREMGDAFAHAMVIAAEQGAGTLVHVGRFDLAEFAVVLEPEEPLMLARRVLYAGMVALADALTAHAQPGTTLSIDWPDSISINVGLVGGGRLGWPRGVRSDATPPWLVFGAMVRTVSISGAEPGTNPLATSLEEEGFTNLLSGQVVESFARHFMVALDAWRQQGFAAVATEYLRRLTPERSLRRHIDDNGDLLLRRTGENEVERDKLLPRLQLPSWLDPTTGQPRL